MEWSRPESIPFPNIWKKFDGLREINAVKPKFWIQDVTEDLVESIVEAMLTGFIREEPLCKYSNSKHSKLEQLQSRIKQLLTVKQLELAEDSVSVAEGMELYKYVFTNKLTVVCMTNDSEGNPKLAGISCLARLTKDDPHLKVNGECLAKLRNLVDYAYSVKDPFTHFEVDEYLIDKGIYILPEFRGQGICYEFLQSWVIICKAVGLKVVMGSFTSIVSQRVADRAEYKELNSFTYAYLEKINPKYRLPGIEEHTRSLRLLYKLV